MPTDNSNELFPIVDEKGYIIGSATRGECHSGSMLLHPVVHLHVFDRQGRLYLQKRPLWKDIQPGKWDTAVGGHVDFGEETCDALRREAREEGREEGRLKQAKKTAANLRKRGSSFDEIAEILELPADIIRAWAKETDMLL